MSKVILKKNHVTVGGIVTSVARRVIGLARYFLMLAVLGMTPTPAHAAEFVCENGYARIDGGGQSDRDLICEAAQRAAGFLETMGIPGHDVHIEISDTLPSNHSEAIGCYHWGLDRIVLPDLEHCSAPEVLEAFGNVDADELTIGFVAYEIAHATARHAFGISDPTVTTQEYIAAVVQIGVIERVERERVLEALDGSGFATASEINLFAYQVDPAGLAAAAYRHFMKPENGAPFIQKLLSGKIVLADKLPYHY